MSTHPPTNGPVPHLSSPIPHWSAQPTGLLYNQLSFRARLINLPDDGGNTHLWNVGRPRFENTAVHPRRLWTSYEAPSSLDVASVDGVDYVSELRPDHPAGGM
jgi:hypothetical protein